MDWNLLPSSLSGQVIWKKLIIIYIIKKDKNTGKKPIVTLAGTTGRIVLKRVFVVIIQGCLSFMAKKIPEYYDDPVLKSMLRVFSLFKVRFQFENDDVTGVCNH